VDLLLEFWSHFWVTISLGITAGIVKLFIAFIAGILESMLNWGVSFIILELFLWNYGWELSFFFKMKSLIYRGISAGIVELLLWSDGRISELFWSSGLIV
jgi:hypothetical protein